MTESDLEGFLSDDVCLDIKFFFSAINQTIYLLELMEDWLIDYLGGEC